MTKQLTRQDLCSLFDLACTYWLAKNWDEAMAAEFAAQKLLKDYEDRFPLWRDLIDYQEVFYRENGRRMTYEEAIEWMVKAGMAEIMSD